MLVTGATGEVGGKVVRILHSQHVSVKGLVRNLDSPGAMQLLEEGIEVVLGDFNGDLPSLQGVQSVFLVCSNDEQQHRLECNMIDAAAKAGLEYIVKLSTYNPVVGDSRCGYGMAHAAIESHLAMAGPAFTVIRPDWFMVSRPLLGCMALCSSSIVCSLADEFISAHRAQSW